MGERRVRIAPDANVMARAMAGDDPDQSARAKAELAAAETIALGTTMVCELVWVLARGYRVPAREIAVAIQEFAQQNDLMNFIETDRTFHSGILELSGNPMLVEVADQFRSRARIHALPFILESGQLETSAFEHIQILDAMEQRDLETVAKVMEHHINYTIDAVFAMSLVKKAAK